MTPSKGVLFAALVLVPVLGCAPKPQSAFLASIQTQTLPVHTGRLVTLQGSDLENSEKIEELRIWAKREGAEVRVVDAGLGVAEVFGASQDEIQQLLPEARVTENVYLPNLIHADRDPAQIFEAAAPAIRCSARDDLLKMDVGLPAGMESLFDRGVARLGSGALTLRAQELNGVAVTMVWMVNGPADSAFADYVTVGADLTLTPDLPGLYNVMVVFARGDGRCLGSRLQFGVTTSEEFQGKKVARGFIASDRDLFQHLAVVDAESAWTVTKGKGVKVAVIDTGVNFNHPDLSANIATATNGKVIGHNFWAATSNAFDDQGHGTHVAGLAASAVMGVAPEATIIPIKALNAMGGGDLASIVAAIRFAGRAGAHVINASFGAEDVSFAVMQEAIQAATDAGALFVVAAGNGEAGIGFDIDARPVYPATLPVPGLLSVAATRLDGALSVYSNFGARLVHVAAPGGDPSPGNGTLMSANYLPGKRLYVGEMGTSMATPVTVGIAALAKARHMSWTAVELKEHLMRSGTSLPALAGKVVSGQLLSASLAVEH